MNQSNSLLYFAYGSNMNSEDLEKWCVENHSKISLNNPKVALLKDFQLAFTHKSNRRNGGVADIVRRINETVWGVLFETDKESLENIDIKEGVASGVYRQFRVEVLVGEEPVSNVITYEVIKKGIYRPSRDYLNVILTGAVDHHLPVDYIEKLRKLFEPR